MPTNYAKSKITMIYDGYKSKYEKSISNDEYSKTVCIYEVSNGYVVKVEKIPKDKEDEGMYDYENRECKYYISEEDPSHLLEDSKGKDYSKEESESSGAKEAIEKLF